MRLEEIEEALAKKLKGTLYLDAVYLDNKCTATIKIDTTIYGTLTNSYGYGFVFTSKDKQLTLEEHRSSISFIDDLVKYLNKQYENNLKLQKALINKRAFLNDLITCCQKYNLTIISNDGKLELAEFSNDNIKQLVRLGKLQ